MLRPRSDPPLEKQEGMPLGCPLQGQMQNERHKLSETSKEWAVLDLGWNLSTAENYKKQPVRISAIQQREGSTHGYLFHP